MLRFRSSSALRSLSFVGTGISEEMRSEEKIPDSTVSTVWRRSARGFIVGSGALDKVNVRVLRRRLPLEMKDPEEGDVGVEGCVVLSDDLVLGFASSSDGLLDEAREGIDVAGATSLATRASMNVTKVKETLWAGEYARLSNTQAWDSSHVKGGALDFSRARIC